MQLLQPVLVYLAFKLLTLPTTNHIVLLCSRLDLAGGIERAVVNTANLFAEQGKKITLLVLDETAENFYPVHSSVNILQQPLSFGITKEGNVITRKIKLLTDVLKLRKLFKQLQPDLIIASEYPFAVASVLTGIRKKARIISWEHHHYHELKRNNFWERSFRNTYPKLDTIVCLNEDERILFKPVNPHTVVIPNFISPAERSVLKDKMILTIARLTEVKGIGLLLETAKELLFRHPGWQWKLIGDGEMKEEVNSFIEKEYLKGKLILQQPLGPNILHEYQAATMYVMTSRHECFPMVLLEAQAAGLPCIAFDCETGPRHIIRHNENGLLVEKENSLKLADAISSLVNDEGKRKRMGEQAFADVRRFSPEAIYELWEELIDER